MASKPRAPLTRRDLAALLGKHPMTITKWEQAGLPVATRGSRGRPSLYDESAVRVWLQRRDEAAQHQAPDLLASRARRELAQAVEAEQRVAIKAGRLIAIEDVDRIWSAQVAAVRTRLLAIPVSVADRLHRVATLEGATGVEAVLLEVVHNALHELASGVPPPTPTRRRRAKKGHRPTRRAERST